MNPVRHNRGGRWITPLAVTLAPGLVCAQSPDVMSIMPTYHALDTNRMSLLQVQVETSYTANGTVKFMGTEGGSSDAFNARLSVFTPVPIHESWVIPLGLSSQNLVLGAIPGIPIPDEVHTLSLTTGLGHRLNDSWMIMGMLSPILYGFENVGRNDFGFSGGINALWRFSPTLALRFGVLVAPDSDIPVLPMVGADWLISEQLHLRLMFPQPRLIYHLSDHWSFHGGADIVGTTFRTSNALGTIAGQSAYNDALGNYRDVRLGVGTGWRLSGSIRAEIEAGYSVSRRIDYTDLDVAVDFAPAPFVRLGFNLGF